MTFRAKIFACFLLLGGLCFYQFYTWAVRDLKPGYRKATEEPLVDMAHMLASFAELNLRDGAVDVASFRRFYERLGQREVKAPIYDFLKSSAAVRVYITDKNGIVLFDSRVPGDEGKNYSQWRDVAAVLRGEYGARTTDEGTGASTMYVAAPILHEGALTGVLSVGKSTAAANLFVQQARRNILSGAIVILCAFVAVGYLLSHMVSVPVARLTRYARAVRDGQRVQSPRLGSGELGVLTEAFEEMRETLEGKRYVEHYVETLTHELKSPLAAISGAVELLGGDPPDEDRRRFLANIEVEAERLRSIVEQLLLLSALEAKKTLENTTAIKPETLIDEVVSELSALSAQKCVSIEKKGSSGLFIQGELRLLSEALRNVAHNSLDFSPPGTKISISVSSSADKVTFVVEDEGLGVPEYAREKVFDRFYSLPRPGTGKKSSGLGLSIVREITELHGGTVTLEPREERGTRVRLSFPAAPRSRE